MANEPSQRGSEGMGRRPMLKLAGMTGASLVGGGLGTVGATPAAGAVAASSSVLDDFEDGDLSEYSGNTGSFTVQSGTTLEGSYTLKGTSANVRITADALSTPRGYEYTLRTKIGTGSAGKADFYVCGQATGLAAFNNCYYVRADAPNDTLFLVRRDSGANTILDSVNVTVDEGTEYRLAVELAADTVRGRLLDSSGTEIAATAPVSDSTYTDGTLGYNVGNGAPIYVDYVTEEQLGGGGGGGTSQFIEDFEDGDLSEYSGNTEKFSVQSATTIQGSYTLKGTSTYGRIAADDITTYRDREYRCRVMAGSGSGAAPCLVAFVQHPDYPLDSCYFVRIDSANDTLDVVRADGGTDTQLATVNVTIDEGTEYILALKAGLETIQGRVLDANDTELAATGRVEDTTYSDGALGFYTGGGAPAYYDAVSNDWIGRLLGNYETDLDGWSTNGSNSLSQVHYSEQKAPVTRGEHSVEVTIDSDPEPRIEGQAGIRQADLTSYPYLLADVLPANVENSDSAVTFRFRYHHTDPGGVEESPEMTIGQEFGGRIAWDMNELSDTKLTSADKLDVVWYPENHPPSSSFDYNGVTCVDNVHLTNNRDAVPFAKVMRKRRELNRAHGNRVETDLHSQTDSVRKGSYIYDDETEVPFQVELHQDSIEHQIDGESFQFPGGSV